MFIQMKHDEHQGSKTEIKQLEFYFTASKDVDLNPMF